MPQRPHVTVAGHVCLDIIPALEGWTGGLAERLRPGTLSEIGPAVLSTGGAVSNTGLALHRLGVPTQLMGKIGADLFGDALLHIFCGIDPALTEGMLTDAAAPTSYTVVLSPPGVDRLFLHCAGANDTLSAADIRYDRLAGTRIFHFGYPPILRRFYVDGGSELATVLQQAHAQGVATSLDMAMPDPNAPSGRADWRAILRDALPHADLFLPSLDELRFMLRHTVGLPQGAAAAEDGGHTLLAEVSAVSEELLGLGAAVVGLKLGDRGFYVRTTPDADRLAALRRAAGADLADWTGRELLTPCFRVQVAGTTGCGDCTVAGFLAGLLQGLSLEETLTAAVAVGACSAERPDATSGVRPWPAVLERIRAGWAKHPLPELSGGWRANAVKMLACGPHDREGRSY
ncbi:MAG: carbohydrate kinase family protein [Planctomycetota bacterium]